MKSVFLLLAGYIPVFAEDLWVFDTRLVEGDPIFEVTLPRIY
jgi:hypothetical protein